MPDASGRGTSSARDQSFRNEFPSHGEPTHDDFSWSALKNTNAARVANHSVLNVSAKPAGNPSAFAAPVSSRDLFGPQRSQPVAGSPNAAASNATFGSGTDAATVASLHSSLPPAASLLSSDNAIMPRPGYGQAYGMPQMHGPHGTISAAHEPHFGHNGVCSPSGARLPWHAARFECSCTPCCHLHISLDIVLQYLSWEGASLVHTEALPQSTSSPARM